MNLVKFMSTKVLSKPNTVAVKVATIITNTPWMIRCMFNLNMFNHVAFFCSIIFTHKTFPTLLFPNLYHFLSDFDVQIKF